MLKRTIIALVLIIVGIVALCIIKGCENLLSFAPLLPPIIAIALAFITHEVLVSLFVGIFVGSVMTLESNSFFSFISNIFKGLFKAVDTYVKNGIADSDHASIIIFLLLIGGVVGLIGKSGGLTGIVDKLSKTKQSSVLSQFYTWLMGIIIFFDDYANSLIVGNTMRPITDQYGVSREKLSFIVDATAAPVSSLVIVSTWIGYEVGLIQDVFKTTGITLDPYITFINTIPYRFYVILMLLFIPIIIFSKRDMFSMLIAERRARATGEVLKKDSTPLSGEELHELDSSIKPNILNAIIPMAILIFGVLIGLYYTGYTALVAKKATSFSFREILGSSDSFKSLIWSSLFASIVLIVMMVTQKVSTFKGTMDAWMKGVKSMMMAIIILSLAWALGGVLKDIKTAECVTALVNNSISPYFLPLIVFLISSAIAFATGSSWGSMAIIFPIAIPLAKELGAGLPEAQMLAIIYGSIGSILSGTVFGDHCSPISDTTIMSSIASSVDHMDHVSTQLPYALLVGIIACLTGYLPAGFGFNPYLLCIIGLILTGIAVFVLGKKVENIES